MSKAQPAQKERPKTPLVATASPHWSDDRLVRDCLAGKDEAWAALLDKYQNLIFSIPIKHRLPREEAAEIFQAVCAELLSELPKLRDPQALSGWLIKVTSNKCLHWHKQQQRWNAGDADAEDASTPAENLAENLLIEVEKEQKLREAISKLSPRCSEMIRILFYEDPPRAYKEVAESLGIAVGSIGFIRGRCLDKLRASLEDMEFR